MVAHTSSPSYSGGRDGEDSVSRLIQGKISETRISTNKPDVDA
jgi:hypothetical protein